MNFELDEEQIMLQTSARDLLEKECPISLVRKMMEDETGYSPELWQTIARQGWIGLLFPEEYGGAELTFLDLAVLLEECGRALLPGPLLQTIIAGRAILKYGSGEQKINLLPGLISGETIVTTALAEPGFEKQTETATILKTETGRVLNGSLAFVPFAHCADYLLHTSSEQAFLINLKTPGIAVRQMETMSGERPGEIVFENAFITDEAILGTAEQSSEIRQQLLRETAVAESALMTGGAGKALEITIDYVKERQAFGQPVGSFQAVQHKLADIALEVEGAQALLYYAAWTIHTSAPDREMAASMVKAWANEAYKKATNEGVQLHGGIGFTWDHAMHLYFKQARSAAVTGGSTRYHQAKVAELLEL